MRAVVTYNHGDLDRMVFEQSYRDPVPAPVTCCCECGPAP